MEDQIELRGVYYADRGIDGRPIIYIDDRSDAQFSEWLRQHEVFTTFRENRHPVSGAKCRVLYPSPEIAATLKDGENVVATIGLRRERRGTGIRFVQLARG